MTREEELLRLSAFADGELEGAPAEEVRAALAADPGLRRELERFRVLDRAAAALPVPEMDESAARALWQEIAARTFQRSGAAAERISAAPDLAPGVLPPVPQVAPERWNTVWSAIAARIGDARPVAGATARRGVEFAERPASARVLRARVQWSRWAGLAAAALVVAAVTLGSFLMTRTVAPPPPPVTVAEPEVEAPEVLDSRYFMLVKKLPGLDKPVVCFYLKEPEAWLELHEL